MVFLELVNKRLDYVKAYHTEHHYKDYISLARRWIKEWGNTMCVNITPDDIQKYMIRRSHVSQYTANKDLRYLRAVFNYGLKRDWIKSNPTKDVAFMPVEKRIRYVPSTQDVLKVIMAAEPEMQDYLWTLKETLGRISEINRLTWTDIDFDGRFVILYTRKKQGGHLTPRKVPMTKRLYDILLNRYQHRAKDKPWVFWQRYWDRKKNEWVEGPYKNRSKIMKTLCRKADVKYFRYHPFRHLGASTLDRANVNIGSIQRILGHENRTTTEIYLHSIGEAERDAMRMFEDFEKSHTDSHTDKKEVTVKNL
jgi:integrase